MRERGRKLQVEALAIRRRRHGPVSAYDVFGELREANSRMARRTRLLHRSSSIEGTGQTGLLLVLNPVADPDAFPVRPSMH